MHEDAARLVLTFNATVTHMEIRMEVKDRIISHDRPVVGAVYSLAGNQVITADDGGVVSIWFLDSGQRVKQITDTHPGHPPLPSPLPFSSPPLSSPLSSPYIGRAERYLFLTGFGGEGPVGTGA